MPPAQIPFRNVLVIANPIAGRGRGASMAHEVERALRTCGARCELHLTTGRGDARERASRLGPDVDLVVSIGGDGTLSEVLHGLPRHDMMVGVLPMGTANVLSLDLKLPRDVPGFMALCASGRAQLVDTASVNGDMLSFLVTGIGFDAAVVRAMERRRRGPISKFDWVRAGLGTFFTWSAPRLELEVDGSRVPGDFGQVLVSNIVHYAGFDVLSPDRKLDDGLFEVYAFEGRSKARFLAHALRGAISRFPSRSVSMRRGKHVVVRSDVPAPFQIDGDYCGETPLELTVGSNPFRILVP